MPLIFDNLIFVANSLEYKQVFLHIHHIQILYIMRILNWVTHLFAPVLTYLL